MSQISIKKKKLIVYVHAVLLSSDSDCLSIVVLNVLFFPFSVFLGNIKQAFDKNQNLSNLLLDDFFKKEVQKCQVKKDLFTPLVAFDLHVIDQIIFWLSYVLLRNLVEQLFVMSI